MVDAGVNPSFSLLSQFSYNNTIHIAHNITTILEAEIERLRGVYML